MIAHRLSTIRRAEQILVVEGGRIVGARHATPSLYAARGRYRDMYTRQHGVEANLFLAPGEGREPPPADAEAKPADAEAVTRRPGPPAEGLKGGL